MAYLVIFSLAAIAYGVWAIRRPVEIAQQNKQFIDSGEETYFEQRRAWKAYGTTPSTEPAEVARRGRKEIIFGVMGLAIAAIFYLIEQGPK